MRIDDIFAGPTQSACTSASLHEAVLRSAWEVARTLVGMVVRIVVRSLFRLYGYMFGHMLPRSVLGLVVQKNKPATTGAAYLALCRRTHLLAALIVRSVLTAT